ncbi:MAG: hypothetical protein HKN28_05330 [Alphaproteobacteria bacterium]|nr:hypothetical protein [Alphaproteobacteria bacterium]
MAKYRNSPQRTRSNGCQFRHCLKRVASTVIVGLVAGAPASNVSAQEAERRPNDFERAYTAIALDMESADLCGKISPNAVSRAPFNSTGTRIVSERSRCFFNVALRTLNPHHCGDVRQVGSRRQGGHYSNANCQKLIAQGRRFNASLSFNHKLILQAVGYTDADVTARFPRHPTEDSWLPYYHSFFRLSDGGLQRRLPRLPDFSSN